MITPKNLKIYEKSDQINCPKIRRFKWFETQSNIIGPIFILIWDFNHHLTLSSSNTSFARAASIVLCFSSRLAIAFRVARIAASLSLLMFILAISASASCAVKSSDIPNKLANQRRTILHWNKRCHFNKLNLGSFKIEINHCWKPHLVVLGKSFCNMNRLYGTSV